MNRNDAPKKQPVPFGVNGQRESLLSSTPAGDNTASYSDGFPPVTMILKAAGGLPPKGQDMNQILYELSALARWSSSGALNSFDSDFANSVGGYPKGALLLGDDGKTIYISTNDANTANPNSVSTGWFNLSTAYQPYSSQLTYLGSHSDVDIRDYLGVTQAISNSESAIKGNAPSTLNTLGKLAAAINNDPVFYSTIAQQLNGKQPKDATLTDLSGKSVAGILSYLGLAPAGNTDGSLALIGNVNSVNGRSAVVTKTGGNVNGKYRIWSDGTIELWGQGLANMEGNASVNYPITLPGPATNIQTQALIKSGDVPYKVRAPMVVTDLTDATKITFIVMRSDGTTNADGFYWSARYAPF